MKNGHYEKRRSRRKWSIVGNAYHKQWLKKQSKSLERKGLDAAMKASGLK